MIVVVGSPSARVDADRPIAATGFAADIARTATAAGGAVQIVGRVGDDPIGDAVLLDLAANGVGHVAVLRPAGEATPVGAAADGARAGDGDDLPGAALDDEDRPTITAAGGLPIDAADLELALRYLPDYRVIVVAPGLDEAALATATAAAGWSGARLVVIDDGHAGHASLPADATLLVLPDGADTAFTSLVARYAVELDHGTDPGAAFAAASRSVGSQPVEA